MSEKTRKIFLQGQVIPATEEVYQAFYRPIWRVHDFARCHGQCGISDWRRCEGDCGQCRYHTIGDGGSIDFLMDEYELDIEDVCSNPEDIVGEALLLEELLKELDEIDPDGRRIAELLMDGETDRNIATILGMARSSFSDRKLRIRKELKKRLQKFF